MRWTMSRVTLTTIKSPVPPKKADTTKGICNDVATRVGITAIKAKKPAPT